jgi:hypothetical protein
MASASFPAHRQTRSVILRPSESSLALAKAIGICSEAIAKWEINGKSL